MSSACYVLIGFVIYRCILLGKDKSKPAIYKAFGIVALVLFAMAGSMLLLGAMDYIMHWPGGRINMITGAVFALPALVSTIIAIANKNKNKQLNN
jgi:heme A synthase